MTILAPEQAPAVQGSDDDVFTHVVCCDPDVALCGSDVSDVAWVDEDEEATCVVCADLEEHTCTRCGE